MSVIVDIIAFVVVMLAVGATLYYVTKGAADLAKIPNYDKDKNLTLAYKYLTWTAIVGWVLVALVIAGIIAVLIYGSEIVTVWGGILIIGLIVIMLAVTGVLGGLAAYSAYLIQQSGQQDTDKGKTAYIDTIIAAVISLGLIGILMLVAIGYGVRKYKREKELEEARANLKKLRTRQVIEKLETKPETTVETKVETKAKVE